MVMKVSIDESGNGLPTFSRLGAEPMLRVTVITTHWNLRHHLYNSFQMFCFPIQILGFQFNRRSVAAAENLATLLVPGQIVAFLLMI